MKITPRSPRTALLTGVVVMLASFTASAHEVGGHGRGPGALRSVADRIAGGSSILYEMERNRDTKTFHDRAHHFQDQVRDRGTDSRHLVKDWQDLRRAFQSARRSVSSRRSDDRPDFLLHHLEEDFAEGERMLGVVAAEPAPQGPGTHSFIRGEECIGVNPVQPRPCPSPRKAIKFRVPAGAQVIRKITGQWRDYGRGVKAQVLVDGQLVWQTDVGKDWDGDARGVNVPVRPGSVVTLRSSNGDPLWVRRLDIEYGR